MHILVTRPLESAYSLTSRLHDLGHQVIIDPLIHITPIDPDEVLKTFPSTFEAIVTTSQQAIRCLSHLTPQRDFPLWCVGDESANIAKEVGFQNIHAGQGSAEDLLEKLVASISRPLDKPLIHVSGDVIRVNMVEALRAQGIPSQRVIVYRTQEATTLSFETQSALKTSTLDVILFYSPRTGQIFKNLCHSAQLEPFCSTLTALCLSPSIKETILDLPWKNIRIAKKTTTDDLLIALMMAD